MSRQFFLATLGLVGDGYTPTEQSYLVVLGDSIIQASNDGYLNPLATMLGMLPVNGGVGGTALSWGEQSGLARYPALIRPFGKFQISIGINDLGGGQDGPGYEEKLRELLDGTAEKPGLLDHYTPADVYISTINWCVPFGGHYSEVKHLAVNNVIRNIAPEYGLNLIDLYPHFVNKPELFWDGLHLTPEGYALKLEIALPVYGLGNTI